MNSVGRDWGRGWRGEAWMRVQCKGNHGLGMLWRVAELGEEVR